MINGIVIIHKEPGFTSHDVVAKMRGICGQKKIGHTGTLDPAAAGVLPVCLGSATKLWDMLTDKDKEYVAELLLGVETDTQDTTGRVLAQHPVTVSREAVEETVFSFLGAYGQIPPMYSALKVDGRRLYELARAGKEVERKARPVTIHELEILEYRPPIVAFRAVCSKGTYIRTLCADIGEQLGCGGTMQSLRRTRVGDFRLENAITLGRLQQLRDEGRLNQAVLPVESVFLDCPAIHVREEFIGLLENGNRLVPEQTEEKTVYTGGKWVRMYGKDELFRGIYAYEEVNACYKPVKMFLPL